MKRKGYMIWLILLFAYAINFFHSLSMGVIKGDLMAEFQIGETTFISIGNMYANLYLIMQIPAGLLSDYLGARKTSFLGMAAASAGVILFGLAQSTALLYLGRGLVGLGTSVLFVCILKIQANWFPPAVFGTMTGWTCFVGTMGGAFAQSPLAFLTDMIGWRASFLGVGALSVAVVIGILLVVRNTPAEAGYALGMEGGAGKPSGTEPGSGAAAEPRKSLGEMAAGIIGVFCNPRTWPICLAYAISYGTYVVLMGYYGTSFIMETYGKSAVAASLYITAGVVGSAVGAAVIGTASDKLKSRKKPMAAAGIGYLGCWVFLSLFCSSMPEYLVMPLLFAVGFLSCGYVVSWPAANEVNDPSLTGISTSVANMGGFFGSITIPLIAGKAVEAGGAFAGKYDAMFYSLTLLAAVGAVCALLVTETKCVSRYAELKEKKRKRLCRAE